MQESVQERFDKMFLWHPKPVFNIEASINKQDREVNIEATVPVFKRFRNEP